MRAQSPGAAVPLAILVREAWQLDDHPLRHDTRIAMTISRLRDALSPTVMGGKEGYTLMPPGTWAVLAPIGRPGGRWGG